MEDQEWMSVFGTSAEGLQDVWTLQMDDLIQPNRTQPGFYEYLRGSFAEFLCSGCGHSWASARVLVVFHFSLDAACGRGSVKMRRCTQGCRRCGAPKNEKPKFSRENINVMVENLIENIKVRCYGEIVEESRRSSHFSGKRNGPHDNARCEACTLGICQQGT